MTLAEFVELNSEEFQVFFLETSGRSFLKGRQVCSIESAAVNSGLVAKVILRSPYLDLSKSKSFCDLYYGYTQVEFYTINYVELFRQVAVFFSKLTSLVFEIKTVQEEHKTLICTSSFCSDINRKIWEEKSP